MMGECKKCANMDNEYCFACDNGNQFKPLTNADRIRSMSDEELAGFLFEYVGSAPNCKDEIVSNCKSCRDCWLDWLKQEADDDKSGQDQRDDG